MSDLHSVESELDRLSHEYDQLSNDYHGICLDASRLRDVYDLAQARAMLSAPAEYKVDQKKAHVKLACEQQMTACHVAEASQEWYKERLRALQQLLSAVQTRGRILSEEMKM